MSSSRSYVGFLFFEKVGNFFKETVPNEFRLLVQHAELHKVPEFKLDRGGRTNTYTRNMGTRIAVLEKQTLQKSFKQNK